MSIRRSDRRRPRSCASSASHPYAHPRSCPGPASPFVRGGRSRTPRPRFRLALLQCQRQKPQIAARPTRCAHRRRVAPTADFPRASRPAQKTLPTPRQRKDGRHRRFHARIGLYTFEYSLRSRRRSQLRLLHLRGAGQLRRVRHRRGRQHRRALGQSSARSAHHRYHQQLVCCPAGHPQE